MKRIFCTFLTICVLCMLQAQDLRFKKDGTFKIAQLTDIHWHVKSDNNSKNAAIWRKIINDEKPDVLLLTGDVVHNGKSDEGWREIISVIEEFKLPFAVIMGNHDADVLSKDSIYDVLLESPYFIGEKGPEELQGCGNFILPVRASDGSDKVHSVLYCLDSQDYPKVGKWGNPRFYGHYAWIEFDQINWYRSESRRYTKLNGGTPIPSLAFIHIPLIEFESLKGKRNTFGRYGEPSTGAPDINTGFFAQLLACRDVIGVFAGHAHEHDYIGQLYDVALSFGRVSGLDAYGTFERGIRMINLYENERKFDTWIVTSKAKEFTYYYPSGITSEEEEEMVYLQGHEVKSVKPGIVYHYYEGRNIYTDELKYRVTPKKSGVMNTISTKDSPKKDYFGYSFEGLVKIPTTGVYEFATHTTGSVLLTIDGQTVINHVFTDDKENGTNKVALGAGFHKIKVAYTTIWNEDHFKFFVSSKEIEKQEVPAEWLFH